MALPSQRFHDRVRLDGPDAAGVTWLVMERGDGPANAFDGSMVDAMADALDALPAGTGCLVLRGEREFSVGADLSVVRAAPVEARPATIDRVADASNGFIRRLRGLAVPTVAAVNGTAAGGGLGFALSCDVVVMHADAVLDPAYARIGLTPDNATPFFLARALGPYRARALLFEPGPIDAATAQELGLSVRTVEGDAETFDEAVGAFAARLARVPASVQVVARGLVDSAVTDPLDAHLERERQAIADAAGSEVFHEGLAAFFERREPDWPVGSVTESSEE